jgi:hypothetical protein
MNEGGGRRTRTSPPLTDTLTRLSAQSGSASRTAAAGGRWVASARAPASAAPSASVGGYLFPPILLGAAADA